jgi:hypothetical protein
MLLIICLLVVQAVSLSPTDQVRILRSLEVNPQASADVLKATVSPLASLQSVELLRKKVVRFLTAPEWFHNILTEYVESGGESDSDPVLIERLRSMVPVKDPSVLARLIKNWLNKCVFGRVVWGDDICWKEGKHWVLSPVHRSGVIEELIREIAPIPLMSQEERIKAITQGVISYGQSIPGAAKLSATSILLLTQPEWFFKAMLEYNGSESPSSTNPKFISTVSRMKRRNTVPLFGRISDAIDLWMTICVGPIRQRGIDKGYDDFVITHRFELQDGSLVVLLSIRPELVQSHFSLV